MAPKAALVHSMLIRHKAMVRDTATSDQRTRQHKQKSKVQSKHSPSDVEATLKRSPSEAKDGGWRRGTG